MININVLVKYFLISFFVTLFLLVTGISLLKKINCGQYVRKLGPKSHYTKQGTPTMGGVYIIIGISFTFIISLFVDNPMDIRKVFMILMPLLLYGLLGFIDDYRKVSKKNNDGLSARAKIIFQILWAAIYFFLFLEVSMTKITLFNYVIDLKWFYGVVILLMFIGTSNAYNICDGMDGLAGGLGLIIFAGALAICEDTSMSVFMITVIGSIFAFMCYNVRPAKVFMGDVGSMAIGATIANIFIIMKCELLLFIFGFVLIIEAMSVIIQVGYYKISKGKRVFLMAPLHHHFELKGNKESKVVMFFWLLELIAVVVGLIIYKKY